MTAASEKRRISVSEYPAGVDAELNQALKAERRFSRSRRLLVARLLTAKPLTWPSKGKPRAMEAWAASVMAANPSRAAIRVAWTLTFFFNSETGRSFVTHQKLADFADLHKDTVKAAIQELDQLRLIVRRVERVGRDDLTVIVPAMPESRSASAMGGGGCHPHPRGNATPTPG